MWWIIMIFFRVTACIIYAPIWLKLWFYLWCHIDLGHYSRGPLSPWGLHLIILSPMFLEGAQKFLEELYGAFRTTWHVLLRPYLLGGLYYFLRFPVSIRMILSCGVLWGSFLIPWFLSEKVSKVFGGTASWW